MSSVSNRKRILVVIPTSTLTQRQLLEGLLEYAHESATGPWQFHLDLRDLNRQRLRDLKSWSCDGIIAYILSDRQRQDFIATGLPAVFIEPTLSKPLPRMPRNVISFINEHATEGRTAANYFIERQYTSFAYIGTAKPTFWSDERMRGFSKRLKESGFAPIVYPAPPVREQNDFALEAVHMTKWLSRLPHPTAVFCVHDRRAQQVVVTATAAGMRIPEDIAILGVDNDEILCEMTMPAISSIPVNDHERGMAVGEAMARLLERRHVKHVHITRHDSVITRTSTDAQAIADPFVARAIAYVRAHLSERPSIPDIARAAGCSKTVLTIRAQRVLGHSIHDEIVRHQVNIAIERLANTSSTVEEIAQTCGFCSASHLGLRLKEATGHTSSHYRRIRR